MYDVVVIGKGPAGVSAAIYAIRSGMKTLVIGSGVGMLSMAKEVENYYGIEEVLSGSEIQQIGERQLANLGGELINAEVTGIGFGQAYIVNSTAGDFDAKTVIIAVGKSRRGIRLPGAAELEGKGVSYCAVCDGFFYKGKNIGVLGDGDYALHEAQHLAGFAEKVTIFTNGKAFTGEGEHNFEIIDGAVERLLGEDVLTGLTLKDGNKYELEGLFVAVGQASAADFAQKLGIEVVNGNIKVDENGMTNMPGIFAAGDCIGGLYQMSTAVGEGAVAGQRAAEYVKKNK
ncbi:MAG: NAD(P)/FAD-dependent oxidoreductase [Clostridiales bacterium]|nr:NAD(P)/FAD-dependent oxidoreductase [Clostridiales bacterium]